MIRRIDEAGRAPFLAAVRGKPYFGDVLPVHLAVFGEAHALMRFYTATPAAAMQLRGQSALLCGACDAEETGAFLWMQGIRRVNTDGAVPAGYAAVRTLCGLVLQSAPAVFPPALPSLTLDRAPSSAEITDFLMHGKREFGARDNFYSELCTKRSRGAAEVWAVRQGGALVATAGAYALSPGAAYLAAVETAAPLRGHGVGSWLVSLLARHLADGGRRVTLTCREDRLPFYRTLGFAEECSLTQCERTDEQKETV